MPANSAIRAKGIASKRAGVASRPRSRRSASSVNPKKNGNGRNGEALQEIGTMVLTGDCGVPALSKTVTLVQSAGKYRWVGLYQIKRQEFVFSVGTGDMPPAYPRFPITQGISAEAVETRKTVNVPNVTKDKRFLPNFWSSKAEMIVPIIDDEHDKVLGVIVVESSRLNAFDRSDRDFLEGVARLIWRCFR